MSDRQPAPGTPGQPEDQDAAAAPPKRTRRASKTNPGGSSNDLRADVLRALAVVKIATPHQLWRLLRPHALENKFARAALNDLDKKRIAVKHGTGKDGRDIWGMTTAGREAAKALFPDGRDMGGIARKAGTSSAAGHALAVTETIISFVVGGTGPNVDPKGIHGDRTAPGVGPGFGRIEQWATEIQHLTPHKPTVRADAVLRAPDHGLPVLLVEVDLDNESNPIVAKKLDDYRAFFDHRHPLPNPHARGTIGYLEWKKTELHWRRTYPDTGRPGYPPVAIMGWRWVCGSGRGWGFGFAGWLRGSCVRAGWVGSGYRRVDGVGELVGRSLGWGFRGCGESGAVPLRGLLHVAGSVIALSVGGLLVGVGCGAGGC